MTSQSESRNAMASGNEFMAVVERLSHRVAVMYLGACRGSVA